MKFLVDRCAGHLLAEWLRRAGHDVIESRDLGPDPGVEQLLQIAHSQGNANLCLRPMSSYILEAQIDGDLWSDARTTYTFQVRALGSLGQSDWSDVATRICQ